MPEPITLLNGGGIIPLDLTLFRESLQHRVDPATLPGLPAGVTLQDLIDTLHTTMDLRVAEMVNDELMVRTLGYLPVYGSDGFDQFGYDRGGTDREGRGRDGLTEAERTADPMLDDRPRPPRYGKRGEVDRRQFHEGGKKNNRGNKRGQIVLSQDGTERTLDKCWFDVFLANESLPIQRRRTDAEILAHMQELFPGRKFREAGYKYKQSGSVMEARWRYNNGRLACQKGGAPTEHEVSHIYVKSGNTLAKTTARGRVVEQWDLTTVLLGESKRRGEAPAEFEI